MKAKLLALVEKWEKRVGVIRGTEWGCCGQRYIAECQAEAQTLKEAARAVRAIMESKE